MSDIPELIERLESATGPDRELDREIRDAVFQPCINNGACYTSSIDKALTLAVEARPDGQSALPDMHPYSVLVAAMAACPLEDFADSLPRFICAAAMRARAASGMGAPR